MDNSNDPSSVPVLSEDDSCKTDSNAAKRMRFDKENCFEDSENHSALATCDGGINTDLFLLLPDEMVLQIFSHVPKADLAKSVCLVNHRFKDIALDPALWKELSITGKNFKLDLEMSTTLFERCRMLTSLHLYNLSHVNDSVVPMAAKALEVCNRLNDVRVCQVTNDNVVALLQSVGNSASLRQLKMEGIWNPNLVSDNISCLQRLTTVMLESWTGKVLDCRGLVTIGKHCRSLKRFSYESYNFDFDNPLVIDAESMTCFLDEVKDTIQELKIHAYLEAEDGGFAPLGDCKLLTSLWISTKDALGQILASIPKLPKLRELYISGFRRLAHFGKNMQLNLTELNVSHNRNLNDRTLKLIAQYCPELTKLNFEYSRMITDVGLEEVLLKCKKLAELNLQSVAGITSTPFRVAAPSSLIRLLIDSDYDCIDKDELQAIKNQLPQLKIFDEGKVSMISLEDWLNNGLEVEWSYESHGLM